jgi:hypothetical protein
VVAAGLVSAAAALIYRRPKAIADANESLQEATNELLAGAAVAASATTKVARKVRQKAVAAVEPEGKPSASATKDASAQRGNNGKTGTLDTENAATNTVQQRIRKRRSDAGIKRAAKTAPSPAGVPVGSAPELSLPPVSLSEMETSAFAFGAETSQSNAEAEPAPTSKEEQVSEAHPS